MRTYNNAKRAPLGPVRIPVNMSLFEAALSFPANGGIYRARRLSPMYALAHSYARVSPSYETARFMLCKHRRETVF